MKAHTEETQRRLAALREKERMKSLNNAFDELRGKLQIDNGKRIPKIKTLRLAIEYIRELRRYLREQGSGKLCDSCEAQWHALASERQSLNLGTRAVSVQPPA